MNDKFRQYFKDYGLSDELIEDIGRYGEYRWACAEASTLFSRNQPGGSQAALRADRIEKEMTGPKEPIPAGSGVLEKQKAEIEKRILESFRVPPELLQKP